MRPHWIIIEQNHDVIWLEYHSHTGQMIELIANIGNSAGHLLLDKAHLGGAKPNQLGYTEIKLAVNLLLEVLNVDVLYFQGAVRTTGAKPGHLPRPFKFIKEQQ